MSSNYNKDCASFDAELTKLATKKNNSKNDTCITVTPTDDDESTQSVDEMNATNTEISPTTEEINDSMIQTMSDTKNTFDNASIKLVMPSSKHRTKEFTSLLYTLFQTDLTLTVNWGGPNDNLLGICRILAAGCYYGDQSLSKQSTIEKSLQRKKIITARDSEKIVGCQLAHNQQVILAQIENVARTLAVKDGTGVGNNDKLSNAQLFKAFQAGPISKENEEGAMMMLYFALGVASACFLTGINKDIGGFSKVVGVPGIGETTSHLYAQSKKMLVTHVMKTLATRLNLDSKKNEMLDWHHRLNQI